MMMECGYSDDYFFNEDNLPLTLEKEILQYLLLEEKVFI
jgi:hypothetical protein